MIKYGGIMARRFYLTIFGFILMVRTASADTVSLSMTPSGTASGLPGSTVGWGFSLANGSSDYLLVSNSYFCESGQDPLFTTCTQSLGTYNDFIANNFTLINPGDTATQSFDSSSSTGIGNYVISNSASAGQSDVGSIIVVYDLYTVSPEDPNFDPSADLVPGGDMEISANAEVDVTGISSVPEPGSLVLLGSALVALAALRAIPGGRTRLLGRL
jgi:hypothetical protein